MDYLEKTVLPALLEPPPIATSSPSPQWQRQRRFDDPARESESKFNLKLATARPVSKPKPSRPAGKPSAPARPKPTAVPSPSPSSDTQDDRITPVREAGFAVDRNYKLLADVRIRQLRVKPGTYVYMYLPIYVHTNLLATQASR